MSTENDAPGRGDPSRPSAGAQRPAPPDFRTFVSGVAGQALIHLGLLENPATGKRERDLDQAKYTIDLLQVLKDKTKGNLTEEEASTLDAALYDLRLRFVEACRA